MNSSTTLGGKKESTEEDLSVADRVETSSYSTTLPDSPVSATEEHNSAISSSTSINSSSSVTDSSSSSKSNSELDKVTKTLNAILLAASFGWAIYTILKVDSGMTRGWTQQEIMMRIPIDNWRSYEYNLNASPIETKTWINVIIYLLGDWLSQTIFQKKNILDFDASRTLKNGFIGLCFGPLVHEYYEFSDRILPLDVDINRLYKIIMDQTIYLAVKCSIYIIAVGLLSGSTLQESIENVKNRIKTVMFTAWSFWPLVHCVTYTVIPARHRILWVNCVDLIWNAILATKARAPTTVDSTSTSAGPVSVESSIIETATDLELLVSKPVELQSGTKERLHALPLGMGAEDSVDVADSVSGHVVEDKNDKNPEEESLHVNTAPQPKVEEGERVHILLTEISGEDINASNSNKADTSRVDRNEGQDCIMASAKSEFLVEAESMLHISPAKVYIENSIGENTQAFAAVDLNTILLQNQTTTIPSTWHL